MAPTRRVLVTLCVLPSRIQYFQHVVRDLEWRDDVLVHPWMAEARDRGPIEKWLNALPGPTCSHVVVVDDDHVYAWSSLLTAIERTRPNVLVQAVGRTLRVRDNSDANGGAYLVHETARAAMRTDIVEGFAGVAMDLATYYRLRSLLLLHLQLRKPSEDERLSDDVVVSRAAVLGGMQLLAVPVEREPIPLRPSADGLHVQHDGAYARYKRILLRDSKSERAWWKLSQVAP